MNTALLKYAQLVSLLLIGISIRSFTQVTINEPPVGTVSVFRNQAVIGRAPSGLAIKLEVNGILKDSGTVRPDGVFEFLGVPSLEGPVKFVVTAIMRNGMTFTAEREIHILGAPDSIVADIPTTEIPADEVSTVPVRITVLDKWHYQVPEGYFVTISTDSLRITTPDSDPANLGIQVPLKRGFANFEVQSTKHVGVSSLTITVNAISTKLAFFSPTPKAPMMVIGSVEATTRNLSTVGPVDSLNKGSDLTSGFHSRGRIAGLARGTVWDDYLLTISVDSDRRISDRLYRELDPNVLYSLYGDNSVVTYEAQSASPIFARLERNRSYVLFGDFNTDLLANEFSAYNRTFTGTKAYLESPDYRATGFATVTNRKVVQEELRGKGISGFYFLSNNGVVTGSEKVRIEVRDKFHSEIIVSRQEKARYADYDIDYTQGSLYFKQPVPSLDGRNNPVYIIVSYEAITNASNNYVAGGSGEYKVTSDLVFGATIIAEQRDPKNYTLLGGNASYQLIGIGKLTGEVARSSDFANSGSAWKLNADFTPTKGVTVRPYYRAVDETFSNVTQSGSGSEVGSTKYGSTFDAQIVEGTKVMGDLYRQTQVLKGIQTNIRSLSATANQNLWKGGDLAVTLENQTYDGLNPSDTVGGYKANSTMLGIKLNAEIMKDLMGNAEYSASVGQSGNQTRPNTFGLGLEYRVTKDIAITAQERIQQNEGQLTTIGVRTQLTEETFVYGKYEIGSTISGQKNAASIGLKNTLKITDDLTANLLLERTKNLSQNLVEARTGDHEAVSASLEYLPRMPLRASLKGEYSTDNSSDHKGFDIGMDYRFTKDFSVLAKGTYSREDSKTSDGSNEVSHYIVGLTYRPIDNDWLNVISKLEIKNQDNRLVQPTVLYNATIVSAHAYVEPIQKVEVGLKYALKAAKDGQAGFTISTLTDFILARGQFDLLPYMNVAAEGRWLRQRELNDLNFGYSAELGFVVMKNTIVAVGYNFKGLRDRDLIGDIYSVQGPYITGRFKFTEQLFGITESD